MDPKSWNQELTKKWLKGLDPTVQIYNKILGGLSIQELLALNNDSLSKYHKIDKFGHQEIILDSVRKLLDYIDDSSNPVTNRERRNYDSFLQFLTTCNENIFRTIEKNVDLTEYLMKNKSLRILASLRIQRGPEVARGAQRCPGVPRHRRLGIKIWTGTNLKNAPKFWSSGRDFKF